MPLLDVPLAAFGLRRLFEAVPDVVMNVRHLPDSVTGAVAPYVPPGRHLNTLFETPEAYGTAGTLVALRNCLGPRVLTWNSDLLTDLTAGAVLTAHSASGAPATIAVVEVAAGADFVLSGDRAAAFVDRRSRTDVAGGVFVGAAVFERAALESLPERRPLGLGETLLASLASSGDLAVHRHEGYRRDVGSVRSYLEASLDLLEGRGPEPPDGSWPGQVAEVERGRAYVGPGAAVGGVLDPGAIVLAGARVDAGARVERAIVWPGEVVPAGAVVEGAIWFGGRAVPV